MDKNRKKEIISFHWFCFCHSATCNLGILSHIEKCWKNNPRGHVYARSLSCSYRTELPTLRRTYTQQKERRRLGRGAYFVHTSKYKFRTCSLMSHTSSSTFQLHTWRKERREKSLKTMERNGCIAGRYKIEDGGEGWVTHTSSIKDLDQTCAMTTDWCQTFRLWHTGFWTIRDTMPAYLLKLHVLELHETLQWLMPKDKTWSSNAFLRAWCAFWCLAVELHQSK